MCTHAFENMHNIVRLRFYFTTLKVLNIYIFGNWQEDEPETTGRGMTSKNDDDVAEDLMLDHDLFLSTLRSRLTKLQVALNDSVFST